MMNERTLRSLTTWTGPQICGRFRPSAALPTSPPIMVVNPVLFAVGTVNGGRRCEAVAASSS
jgi:hypothetical protein